MSWMIWIRENWDELTDDHVAVPTWLPHPAWSGFQRLVFSTPAGQKADWGLPLDDRSRIHVHQFPDGRLVAHRDKYDPDASFDNLLAHVFTETTIGRLTVAVGLVLGLGMLLESGAGS